jgi:cobalt-zinc-cadmium efflux system outer membrane protein
MRRGGATSVAVVALVVLGVAGAARGVLAAEPVARPVTLAEARAAVGHAPAHRSAAARTGAAGAARAASGAWPASSFGVWGTRHAERLGFSASLPLPVFGNLAADRRVAGAELDVARAEAGGVDLGLEREVTRAWLELARAEARAAQSEATAKREDELAQATRKRFEAGDAPRAEVVAADAAAKRARAEADADRAAIAAAAAELAAPLGWDPEVALHAEGGLPVAPAPPPLAELRPRRAGHPEARAAEARARAQDAQVALAHRRRFPELSLDAESLIGDPGLPGTDFKLGVSLTVPLFGGTGAAERAARARSEAARVEHDATLSTLDGAIVAAYRRLQAAERRADALDHDVLPAQREAAELARAAYREGAGGLVAVLEAERALSEAELAYIDARAEAALALVELEWAVGGKL